ncbi:MAG: hypothetical protein P8105_01655 [Dehalococcoidia bacterium]
MAKNNVLNKNKVTPRRFVIEPPTLHCLGFEWYIQGDANHNANVDVWYRKNNGSAWKKALPLLRIQNEESIFNFFNNSIDYITPNMFAGSIFDLEPDTEYECKFIMTDPDGVRGDESDAQKIVHVRTRAEPKPFEGGNTYHVYPPDYKGPKEEPSFPNLIAAYYTGWCEADWWCVQPPRVQPGDIILVHAGIYKDDWTFYGADIWGEGMGTPFHGTYYLTAKGTPEKPIAIKSAGDGEVIFDGNGNYNLFNVLAADYHYFEGLTIRNTYVAFLAGQKHIAGSKGLTIKRCHFEDIDKGIHTHWSGSKNFYIADNVFVGRHDPDAIHGWFLPPDKPPYPWEKLPPLKTPYPYEKCLSEYAIKVCGAGHVICHNYIANFHDGIDHATYGVPDGYPEFGHPDKYPVEKVLKKDGMFVSIDIYNNLITNVHDDFIEADGAMYNIRVLRNLCLNSGTNGLSQQTLFGGPAYFIRNIIYNAPKAIKHHSNPSGLLYYHNTFATKVDAQKASNYHFRNNLILGWRSSDPVFSVDTFTNYTSSDFNGFPQDPQTENPFVWKSPEFGKLRDYNSQTIDRKFKGLKDYSENCQQDTHSIIIDYKIFMNVSKPDPDDFSKVYKADELDFRLKPGTVAIDAGCILPNINDDFAGKAPDLGALESGHSLPVYGPRPIK